MRLIRRKLYRAFPELDRFSDEQCQRFMASVAGSMRHRLVRRAVILAGAAVSSAAAVMLGMWLGEGTRWLVKITGQRGWLVDLIIAAMVFLLVGGGLLLAMVARDVLLRLRVRGLLARNGSCPKCAYSLLGLPVSADLRVRCAECGTEVDVDPALGELARDERGGAVYAPTVYRESEEGRRRRQIRHRRVMLALTGTGVGVVALFVLAYGGWWVWLLLQANRAAGSRMSHQRLAELTGGTVMAVGRDGGRTLWSAKGSVRWPMGVAGDGGGVGEEAGASLARWTRFREVLSEVRRFSSQETVDPRFVPEGEMPIRPDFSSLAMSDQPSDRWDEEYQRRYRMEKEFARALLTGPGRAGLDRIFAELPGLRAARRAVELKGDMPFAAVRFDELGDMRNATRVCGGRMQIALETGDRAAYLAALQEVLALAEIACAQGTSIDRMVGVAIEAFMISRVQEQWGRLRELGWLEPMLEVVLAYPQRPAIGASFVLEEEVQVDLARWFFSDVQRVNRAAWSREFQSDTVQFKGWVSTLDRVEGDIRAAWAHGRSEANLAVAMRGRATAPKPSTAIGDSMSSSVGSILRVDERGRADFDRFVLLLAAEVHRARHGDYPDTLEQLDVKLPERFLIDPDTGRRQQIHRVADPKPGEPGVLFWSGLPSDLGTKVLPKKGGG